jgi:predicted phosphodiesterase
MMDRREFLKTSALAAGGVMLGQAAIGQGEAQPLFTFIALADPHLREDRPNAATGVAKLEKALDVVRALPRPPAFMLLLGDIHPDKIDPFVGNWPAPVHPVHGNHETAPQRQQLRTMFASDFGDKDFYAFTHGDCRFIGLCTAMIGDHIGHFESQDITPKAGQLEFLEQELDQSQAMRHRFLFAHVPPDQSCKPLSDCLGTCEARYLHQLVQDKKVTACFFGHRHANRYYQVGQTGMYGAPSTNWNYGDRPVGFLEVEVYPAEVKVNFIPA